MLCLVNSPVKRTAALGVQIHLTLSTILSPGRCHYHINQCLNSSNHNLPSKYFCSNHYLLSRCCLNNILFSLHRIMTHNLMIITHQRTIIVIIEVMVVTAAI